MKLSIIIPCYNEISHLPAILKKVEDVVLVNGIKKEIILVDDGSKDGSREYIKKMVSNKIKKIYHGKNMGKGAAIRTGIKHSTGDIVIFQDADLELDPKEYNNLIGPVISRECDAVYGSRFLNQRKAASKLHLFGNIFLTYLTRVLYKTKITDMETCYKVIRGPAIRNMKLESNNFNIEPEITAKLLRAGIKIKELPVVYNPRSTKEGKKIKWRDGFLAIWTLLYWRFRN